MLAQQETIDSFQESYFFIYYLPLLLLLLLTGSRSPLIILCAFVVIYLSLSILSSVFNISLFSEGHAQSHNETVEYRNMVLDLGNGIKTNAQLTLPATGDDGPFPGILLVPGSGIIDMNETLGFIRLDNETGTKIYPPTRPYFQIAEYLSQKGFAVLKYDKRGIGENSTIIDSNVWGNLTFDDLKGDAEKALDVLIQQPEVDPNRITVLGHSEGTVVVPRIAIENPDKVNNIVLLGALAENLSKIAELQGVTTILRYAEEVLDHDHDGLISLREANEDPVFETWFGNLTSFLVQNITNTTNETKTSANTSILSQIVQSSNSNNHMSNDIFVSINGELKPKLVENFKIHTSLQPGKKCTSDACPIWQRSTYTLQPNLNIIGNVPSDINILILQGENDTQTPVQQALLLEQRLDDVKHPDHTLITYPDLGHVFYPSSQWLTGLGPIQEYVLSDLNSWLESHSK